MPQDETSADAPPSYSEATRPGASTHLSPSSAAGPKTGHRRRLSKNGIPSAARRSMEDEQRPVPEGWIRQYDAASSHQFFVDTRAHPPRSIWHHPYDDAQYLSSLDTDERLRIEAQNSSSTPDYAAHTTEEESPASSPVAEKSKLSLHSGGTDESEAGPSSSTTTSRQQDQSRSKPSFGRRMKDKITGTTHEEREAKRKERAEKERKAYEIHRATREAMNRAIETGQPQLIGRDANGREVYVEPPSRPDYGMGYGSGYGRGLGMNYNPYAQGPYAMPNSRFARPNYPYNRPYGTGYGGGTSGMGLGLGLTGGLLGGLLLGEALGGF